MLYRPKRSLWRVFEARIAVGEKVHTFSFPNLEHRYVPHRPHLRLAQTAGGGARRSSLGQVPPCFGPTPRRPLDRAHTAHSGQRRPPPEGEAFVVTSCHKAWQPYKGRTVGPLLDHSTRLAGEYRLLPLSSGAARTGGPPHEVPPGLPWETDPRLTSTLLIEESGLWARRDSNTTICPIRRRERIPGSDRRRDRNPTGIDRPDYGRRVRRLLFRRHPPPRGCSQM